MCPDPGKATTTDQLRDEIDRGRTGDKVRFPDPAAAPLGTDDEAAGNAPSREATEHARATEHAGTDRGKDEELGVHARTWLVLVAAVAVIGLLLWAVIR